MKELNGIDAVLNMGSYVGFHKTDFRNKAIKQGPVFIRHIKLSLTA